MPSIHSKTNTSFLFYLFKKILLRYFICDHIPPLLSHPTPVHALTHCCLCPLVIFICRPTSLLVDLCTLLYLCLPVFLIYDWPHDLSTLQEYFSVSSRHKQNIVNVKYVLCKLITAALASSGFWSLAVTMTTCVAQGKVDEVALIFISKNHSQASGIIYHTPEIWNYLNFLFR